MKKIIICLLLITSGVSFACAQTWQWAKSAGGTGYDAGGCVVTDRAGNIYVSGSCGSPTITFGSQTLNSTNNFIAKYDAGGNVKWGMIGGGSAGSQVYAITIDDSCNLYVTGTFINASVIIGKDTLTNNGYNKMFLAKYDSGGRAIWARTDGINTNCSGYCLTTDHWGNIYVGGSFADGMAISFGNIILNNASGSNIFVVKYDSTGKALWANCNSNTGVNTDIIMQGISIDGVGNTFITGYFSSPVMAFGKDTLYDAASAFYEVYVAKFNSNGGFSWAGNSVGNNTAYGFSLVTDFSGNTYVAGSFESSTIQFGGYILHLAGGPGSDNIFIVRYDSSGNVSWAVSNGGAGPDVATHICFDMLQNLLISGIFWSPTITFGSSVLYSSGRADAYAAEYSTSGTSLWGLSAGGSMGDYGQNICVDQFGNAYETGDFYSTDLYFGSIQLASVGQTDMFLAKLSVPLAIPDLMQHNTISVYPNPSNGLFTFSIRNYELGITNIEVYNVLGEQVYSQLSTLNSQFTIDLSGQPNGVYFYRVLSDTGELVGKGKIVIQK